MAAGVILLDQFGKPLKREPAPAPPRGWVHPRLRAAYDAAKTNDDNSRHWANADGLSAAEANSPGVRQVLRNRSRYEYENGAYCNGIVRTRADDLVGIGPTLQILSEDDGVNEKIETSFAAWARASGFAEAKHTMDQARNKDGEAFGLLSTNRQLKHPVKLQLKPVEADRITDPFGRLNQVKSGDRFELDGIRYDAEGNPVSYFVLNEHPGDALFGMTQEGKEVPAKFMLHWYRKDRAGQLRGVPELTPSLPLFPYLRRYTLASLAAAEIAASFAAMVETEAPPDGSTPPVPWESLEIERGMMTTLPAGAKMNQLEPKHPAPNYAEFKREVLQESGRPVRMPVNVSTADSSKHNFSSAKLDHFGYRGALKVDRHFSSINHLDRVFELWVEEATIVGGILPEGMTKDQVLALPRGWYWPGWPSMDKDEAAHDTERLNNGTATLAAILAEYGLDWKTVVRQRGRELKLMRAEGLIAGGAEPAANPTGDPADPAAVAAGASAVQDTALNGAQITSLLLLTDKLSLKQYPAEAVEAIIRAAFPSMNRELVKLFVSALAKFTPPKPDDDADADDADADDAEPPDPAAARRVPSLNGTGGHS